ncbi:hypothetical protein GCL57_10865 [Fluviispira multicolorata]|uniref:Uncharacterized protein n=1 Tax=Fluviispira multicolorata TaxID=2654512 RepID=A0A833JDS0_9BACT|nr:hypothetical protein GCL57_10865 [Fluviispira multicolorata]
MKNDFFSCFNAILISVSRSINSGLCVDVGVFKASFWNHFIGLLFLTCIVGSFSLEFLKTAPIYTYFSGFLVRFLLL